MSHSEEFYDEAERWYDESRRGARMYITSMETNVRGPKARGPQAAQGTMARHSPLRSTLSWRARNKAVVAACTRLDVPRFELRYEDFALGPENTLKALIDFVGPVDADTAPHAEIHSIRGNAVRFDGPAKPIKLDEK